MNVSLSYFKFSGKWYADGEMEYDGKPWEFADHLRSLDAYPGLIGKWHGPILWTDENGLQHLIMPTLEAMGKAVDERIELLRSQQ